MADGHFDDIPKSQYEIGWDMSMKEEATLLLIDAIQDYYLDGYSKTSIAHWLIDERGMKGFNANNICAKSWKLMLKDAKKNEEDMQSKNISRLEHVYAIAMDSGDLAQANKAIDILNKLCKLYTEKVEITKTDFEFDLGDAKE